MKDKNLLQIRKDILEGNSKKLVVGFKTILEEIKRGITVLSSCGIIAKFDWDDEDSSSILVEEFHY